MTTAQSPRVLRPIPLSSTGREPGPLKVLVPERALWLDAFRGFTMLCLISRGFGMMRLREYGWATTTADLFDHTAWAGITPWDLIQPFFMFIVGAAMPFAFEKRWLRGESWGRSFLHVLKRSLLLLVWSHVISIGTGGAFGWQLINVLGQLAFTYLIAFLVLRLHWTLQMTAILAVLGLHYALHMAWPGVHGTPWVKDENFGAALDRTLIWKNWPNGYATLNFLSSSSATIAGVMAANLLRSRFSVGMKSMTLLLVGTALVAAGYALSSQIPVVKRIWTPSFALISIGITLATTLAFYRVSIGWPKVPWGLFTVMGANCIFLYLASQLFGEQVRNIFVRLISPDRTWTQKPWILFTADWLTLGFFIFLAYWVYRRKIFFKL